MKSFRYIAVITLMVSLFSACQKESCPVPFCMMTFNCSVESTFTSAEFPVENVAVFLRNEKTKGVYGPIDLDMSKMVIDEGESGDDVMEYAFTLVQALPYGDYTMWLWSNVKDERVYSFDRFSLVLHNNYAGGDYMLGKARQVSIHSRQASMDVSFERLTAPVNILTGTPVDEVVSLYLSNVYGKVNANGVYSDPTTLEFEKGLYANMPPTEFYTFPSAEEALDSELHLSYNTNGSPTVSSEFRNEKIETKFLYWFEFGNIVY